MTTLKKLLLGLMLFGAVTYFGGGGAFASFSAETSNNGTSVASGTLTMSDTVNGGTGCVTVTTSANVNPNCAAALTLTNVAPGVFGGVGKIAIQNTGSLDASKLSFWASASNATLNGTLTGGVAVTSIPVSGLEGTIAAGDTITVTSGTNTDTFTVNGAGASASNGATAIPVASHAPVSTYTTGATINDTSAVTTSNADCYDVKTTTPGTPLASKGTDLNFNPIAGNPLCAKLLIYVQEITGGKNYCWLGNGAASATGMCLAPVSVNLSSALSTSGAITSLPVTALNGNVKAGDSIVVSSGSNTQTFTVAAGAANNAYVGATSINIVSATPNFAYPTTSTVVDSSTLGTLNSDSSDTLTNFDTLHSAAGRIFVPPVTANGAIDGNAPVQLGHFGTSNDTRTFQIGVYMPAPTGVNQNPLQGLSSTFGITWHIDQ